MHQGAATALFIVLARGGDALIVTRHRLLPDTKDHVLTFVQYSNSALFTWNTAKNGQVWAAVFSYGYSFSVFRPMYGH
jgi:hypothetical protein